MAVADYGKPTQGFSRGKGAAHCPQDHSAAPQSHRHRPLIKGTTATAGKQAMYLILQSPQE